MLLKILGLLNLVLLTSQVASADTASFFNTLDERYMITESSLAIYRSTLPKAEQDKLVLSDSLKKKMRTALANNFQTELEKKFTREEIAYFEKLYKHPLMGKFDDFFRSYVQNSGVETIKKNIAK